MGRAQAAPRASTSSDHRRRMLRCVAKASGGRLFGSVSPSDIAAAVKAAGGPELDRRRIEIKNPIKTVGAHQVTVRLHPEVAATLDVEIVGA